MDFAEDALKNTRSHGVMVSTLDSESSDPSSNLGGTLPFLLSLSISLFDVTFSEKWRNGAHAL